MDDGHPLSCDAHPRTPGTRSLPRPRPGRIALAAAALTGSVLVAVPPGSAVAEGHSAPRPVLDRPRLPPAAPSRVSVVYGTSVRGRPLVDLVVGKHEAPIRVMVIGCLHGNECDGQPVLDRLAAGFPPAGVVYHLVRDPNPDGRLAHSRHNARRVDLNRNFPGWRRSGRPGDVYYPGPGALSEPESKALADLMVRVDPHIVLSYHQAMNLVDDGGGDSAAIRRFAGRVGLRYTRLTRYPGSAATWWHARRPAATVITVELPAAVSAASLAAHAQAIALLASRR